MWVQFQYDGKRPFLEITLANGKESFDGLGLVDSGASMTVSHSDIATALGIDEKLCVKRQVGGITGDNVNGFVADVDLHIKYLPHTITIPVLFVPNLRVSVLLGHTGFLDSYRVKFQADSKFFEIARSPSKEYEKK
jgi:hypothetical protein